MRRLLGLLLLAAWLPLQHAQAQAQDVVLENVTLSITESFEAINSITAGPNVTISSTGDVTFRTKTTALVPPFVIDLGGQLMIIADITVDIESESPAIPTDFVVHQNYPNPFSATTQIDYALPKAVRVEIVVYNLVGQKVRTFVAENQGAGRHSVVWDGTDNAGTRVTSGVYYYKVTVGDFTLTRTLMLIK